jgi:hypothetical protein
MRPRNFGVGLALSLSLAAAYPALAQEYDEAAAMAAYEKAMTPGEHHAKLTVVTEATSTSKMVMGGRYLYDSVEGTAMGMPFNGLGWTGYNNVSERYEATWIDNFGTGIFTSHGQWDDEAGGIVMHGSYADPITGTKTKVKTVSRMEGPDKTVFIWYEKAEGADEARKTMEIVSIRQ